MTAKTKNMSHLIWGVLTVLVGVFFWLSLVKNPFHELALIRRAQITLGSLIETYQDEQEDFRGRVHHSDIGVYSFGLSDGRQFKATAKAPTGQLLAKCEIEFLADDPNVNRVRGDGCRSIAEWFWRKVGLGTLLLALFVSPGVALLRHTIRNTKAM